MISPTLHSVRIREKDYKRIQAAAKRNRLKVVDIVAVMREAFEKLTPTQQREAIVQSETPAPKTKRRETVNSN